MPARCFPMSVTAPDNRIGVMIYNRGNVLASLEIACFIDTNSLEIRKSGILVRFKVVHGTCNTASYSSLGNSSSHNTMNRAGHSVCSGLNFHKNNATVQSSPSLMEMTGIILGELFPIVAVGATILPVLMWLCFNNDLPDTAVRLFKGTSVTLIVLTPITFFTNQATVIMFYSSFRFGC